ncbi:hypothetical protein [Ruminococcus albus]|uniref:Uncharacterized protein n=1 Tax=Ruminococcus albus TaxID=1264 RepID=A0A1H7ITC6_RUMAL|nr:hypothetical protein [Ruminococcus albus]SEK64890.1 hypothetical protein SAMN05216469_10459 [Ruminococcus albus]
MNKFRIPKINSLDFGAKWIAVSLVIGLLLPAVIRIITGVFCWGLCIIGGIILLGFIIVFSIEMHQDFGKTPYYESYLSEDIPFDPDKQTAVVRCSICTGEQIAGFKNKEDGHFTEVMLIRDDTDLEKFKEIYKIAEIKKEY